MKIAVVGAGAIGGYLGGWLAAAGEDVTFIARGANLAAICAGGMRVINEDGTETIASDVRAVEHMGDAGTQDAVLLTVKAHQVANVAGDLHHLCDVETSIVTMQNGIPWWYFHKHGGPFDGQSVRAADPDGSVAQVIDPRRVIGSVVYPAAVLEAPGLVRVVEGRRFSLGELNGDTTERIQRISGAFTAAGFKSPVVSDIRSEIWLKIWGNLSFNPISALTHATLAVDLVPVSADARVEHRDDARSTDCRRAVGCDVSGGHRQAHRGRREGRCAQDVDAPRCRGGPRARDRGADRRRNRARAADRDPYAAHRCGVRMCELVEQDPGRSTRASQCGAATDLMRDLL